MKRKKSYLTATDQFCGAGGSSIGATAAGVEVKLALNHWDKAIATHNTNFPDTLHDCTDISACNPRRYPSTDILITSPECTNHTIAKGKARTSRMQLDLFGKVEIDPASERSRATMWDVPRFAEYHDYNLIIVENVVDAQKWVQYPAWIMAMELLGYKHKAVYFNSMFAHPTPQSRDRMYVVFWKAGNKSPDLDFTPLAYCHYCEKDIDAVQTWKNGRYAGKYRSQYIYTCPICAKTVEPYYYCAANAIDWTVQIERIGDRARPLAEKTLRRIRIGLEKYGAAPMATELAYGHAGNNRSQPLTAPLMTQTTRQSGAVVVPPYIIEMYGTSTTRPIHEALSTMTTNLHHGVVVPFLASYYGTDNLSRVTDALPTVTTVEKQALIMPPMLVGNYSPGWTRPVTEPTGVITTADHHSLVVPPFLLSYYTRSSGQGAAVASMVDPVPTQPTWPLHYLVQPSELPAIEDCGFRMLQPHEIQRAMAFPDDYVVLGNNREKVKQLGNAVTSPVMAMLIERCVATLQ